MAYRYGGREQSILFPKSIEDYVGEDAPVRAYDAFVDALDLKEIGIEVNPNKVGNSQYDPQAMLKLMVYGYSYGVRSSRKLERETHYNLSFIWLVGGLKPDHKTIAEFRRTHREALVNVLKQCARLCMKLGLIAGNTLFIDGSKIRANASIKNTWTQEKCEKYLKGIDKRIEEILYECERIDAEEEDEGSYVKIGEEIQEKERLKNKIGSILEELKEENKRNINTTDRECAPMRSVQGAHASYNVQSVVDEKNGLIVSTDAVSESNDSNQIAKQVEQAQETLGRQCERVCADSGYANTKELAKVDAQGIEVIVPTQRQSLHEGEREFSKRHFVYDREKDEYRCPEGQRLKYRGMNREKYKKIYNIESSRICKRCRHFGDTCTSSKEGRKITRLIEEETRERLEAHYEKEESQAVYRLRKQRVEHPFGHIKRNLKVDAFLMRGVDGVKAEVSLLASCFNIARMINIMGVTGLIRQLEV